MPGGTDKIFIYEQFSVWIGGSVLADMQSFKPNMITADEYHGSLFIF